MAGTAGQVTMLQRSPTYVVSMPDRFAGNVQFSVDGNPVDFSNTWAYKALMFSGMPNMTFTFGYINASWTLRVDLIAEYACRLTNHMECTAPVSAHRNCGKVITTWCRGHSLMISPPTTCNA